MATLKITLSVDLKTGMVRYHRPRLYVGKFEAEKIEKESGKLKDTSVRRDLYKTSSNDVSGMIRELLGHPDYRNNKVKLSEALGMNRKTVQRYCNPKLRARAPSLKFAAKVSELYLETFPQNVKYPLKIEPTIQN